MVIADSVRARRAARSVRARMTHDVPRADSRGFVGHLGPKHGFTRVVLVSGDREEEVRRLADEVSIAQINAGTSPEEKVAIVRRETEHTKTVFIATGSTTRRP